MNLLDIAKAVAIVQPNHSVLLYGPPKSGKTLLAGTAARIPEIKNIYWFDLENGIETLLGMGLTQEELSKITVIKIADTKETPIAIETLLKAFTSRTHVSICEKHGRVDCGECAKEKLPFIKWGLSLCTHNDLVVVDSGSQLGDSALAAACLGKPNMFKPTFDEYGMVAKWMGDITSTIQQCATTNFLIITHEIAMEDAEGKDRIFPLMGSRNFSMKCAKYFGTVAYIHKKMNKHVAGSSSVYRGDVLTGSRINAALEKADTPDMREILIKGGIIRQKSVENATSTTIAEKEKPKQEQAEKPKTLAERIAAMKK